MTTKEYLSQAIRLRRKIENKTAEAAQLRQMAIHISPLFENSKVQKTAEPDKIGNSVAKILDLEKETSALVDELISKRALIISQIDEMDDVRYYHILSKRYIAERTFEEIAAEMTYNMRQVFRVHSKAISEFEKKYGSFYLDKKMP